MNGDDLKNTGGERSGVPSAPSGDAPAPSGPHASSGNGGGVGRLAALPQAELERLNAIADALRAHCVIEAARRLGWSVAKTRRKRRALERGGLSALLRRPRADRGRARVADDAVIARIKSEYLQPHRPRIARVHRIVAREYVLSGKKPPSYGFVRRVIKQIDPDLVARYRIGEREYDDRYAYITLRRRPARPRQWCVADHHPCDHMVVFPDGAIGRPWITAIQDLATNEILGFYLTRGKPVGKGSYPGAEAIGFCLRRAILKKDDDWPSYGLFDHLYADLGRDFRSQHVRALCHDLQIEIVHTRGYHGKSKPIERWFGVLEDALRHLPGYVGSDPEHNPLRQQLRPRPIDARSLLSIEEFERETTRWIVHEYHHAPSRALDGLSPLEALAAHVRTGFVAREVRDERALDLVLMRRAHKLVRNAGIQHFGRYFFAPELLELIGREVEVAWDPAQTGELIVYRDDRYVCTARNRELVDYGASEDTLRRERELRRAQRESLRRRYEEMIRAQQYPHALARAKAEEIEAQVLGEERRRLAANAEAPTATVLLPKYARAVKKLKRIAPAAERPAARAKYDELPTGEELFRRDDNPWLDDELPTGEELFRRDK